MSLQVDLVVGARPNFMKAAPVLEQLRSRRPDWWIRLIHTGQHYSPEMSDLFFRQLGMPAPDVNLGVGSGSHAVQIARMMVALEEEFLRVGSALVMVFGDINSTLAGTLVASRLGLPVAHVEAGLRSFDRSMPEEVNRVVTDTLSSLLFTTEPGAEANLHREGIPTERIHFVGNTMIDTLLRHRSASQALAMARTLGLPPHGYAVLTLHRPSNVDDEAVLRGIMSAVSTIAARVPVVFPVHPRTRGRLHSTGIMGSGIPGLRLSEPMGYLEFIGLMAEAGLVLTDSGGIQEETTILGVPCVTLRNNTERPITIDMGTNVLAGVEPAAISAAAFASLERSRPVAPRVPPGWDGRAAERIAEIVESVLDRRA